MAVKVLFVDDQPEVVEMLRMRLHVAVPEVQVLLAQSAQEALDLATREQPNLVVLDHSIPGVGSTEFVARLRSVDPGPEIVLFSGLDEETLRRRSEWFGVRAFSKAHVEQLVAYVHELATRG